MKPYRDGGAGTLIIDIRVRGVGRIKRASGTSDASVFKAMGRMVLALKDRGRVDLLRALRDGVLTPRELLDAYTRDDLTTLPTVKTGRPLIETWTAWVEKKDCSDAHKRSLAQSLRHLKAKQDTTIAELPGLVEAARERMTKHAQSFRLLRSAAQAFVKATLKRSHPLYAEVCAAEPLKIRAQRVKHPVTPDEMRALVKRLASPDDDSFAATDLMIFGAAEIATTMAVTGMRPNEMWGKWSVEADRVRIHGTKTKGAERVVPRVPGHLAPPRITYRAFRLALAEATDGHMTPYDLRRTYANWMEAAAIPRIRRRSYMGHTSGDTTDRYEWHEVEKYLAEDAAKLATFLGAPMAEAKMEMVR